jgi:2-keto-4-pentenoate hydratase/2-oxohepta-3-ene-1,7-dioic acid hydratase in catechol pathway
MPKFSQEVDADACLAIVIGKAGRRIPRAQAWDHVAGVTLLIDITARDVNRREGLTTNNLLGKNFPSSTSLGPAVLLQPARKELEAIEVELSIDGNVKQRFTLIDCVFSIEEIIARWSMLGIKAGDFFAIGASMALVRDRLQSPVSLRAGVNLRCFSPAIGELSHPVVSSGGLRR